MKKPRRDAGTMNREASGISSKGVTSHRAPELLKHLGEQMRPDYAELINEPLPADLSVLLERLRALTPGPTRRDS